jgi:hypothetical protein
MRRGGGQFHSLASALIPVYSFPECQTFQTFLGQQEVKVGSTNHSMLHFTDSISYVLPSAICEDTTNDTIHTCKQTFQNPRFAFRGGQNVYIHQNLG